MEVREINKNTWRLKAIRSTAGTSCPRCRVAHQAVALCVLRPGGRPTLTGCSDPAAVGAGALVGEVTYIDVFGNLTNVSLRHVKEVREITKRPNPPHQNWEPVQLMAACGAEGPIPVRLDQQRREVFCKEMSASALLKVGRHEPVKG